MSWKLVETQAERDGDFSPLNSKSSHGSFCYSHERMNNGSAPGTEIAGCV